MTRWTQRESVTLFTERSVRWVKRDRGVKMTRWLIDRSIPFSSVLMSVTVVVWWWLQEKTSETSQWSAVMGRGRRIGGNSTLEHTRRDKNAWASMDYSWIVNDLKVVASRADRDDPQIGRWRVETTIPWLMGGERDSLPWGESIVLSEWRVLMVDGELSWQLNEWSIESMVIE